MGQRHYTFLILSVRELSIDVTIRRLQTVPVMKGLRMKTLKPHARES